MAQPGRALRKDTSGRSSTLDRDGDGLIDAEEADSLDLDGDGKLGQRELDRGVAVHRVPVAPWHKDSADTEVEHDAPCHSSCDRRNRCALERQSLAASFRALCLCRLSNPSTLIHPGLGLQAEVAALFGRFGVVDGIRSDPVPREHYTTMVVIFSHRRCGRLPGCCQPFYCRACHRHTLHQCICAGMN